MKDVIRALKVQRRLAVKALKVIDAALAKVGGAVVKRRRRGKGKTRKAKAKAEPKAKAKAPVRKPAAPKVAQGESLADRKRKKAAALEQGTGTEG